MSDAKITISYDGDKPIVEILTERMRMRSFQEQDFEDAVELYSDKKLTRLFDTGNPLSREDVQQLVEDRAYKFSRNKQPLGIFTAFCRETGAFIGHFDILPTDSPGVAEVGCILKRTFHHQNLATEGSLALVRDYPQALNKSGITIHGKPIQKVIATTHPKNFPVIAFLKVIGMIKEGEGIRFGAPRLWYGYSLNSEAKT